MIFIAAFDGRRLPGNKAYANPKSINLAPAHGVSVFYEAPSRKETVAIKAIPVKWRNQSLSTFMTALYSTLITDRKRCGADKAGQPPRPLGLSF